MRGNVTGLDFGDPDGSLHQLTYYQENAAASRVSSVLATVSQHQQALCNQSPSLHFAVKIQSTAFTRSPTNQTIVQLSFELAKYETKIIRQYLQIVYYYYYLCYYCCYFKLVITAFILNYPLIAYTFPQLLGTGMGSPLSYFLKHLYNSL